VGSSCEHDDACSSTPDHAGPPRRQPKSVSFDIEHFGKIYLMGAVSDGSLAAQSDDSTILADLSNVQILVQKRGVFCSLVIQAFAIFLT